LHIWGESYAGVYVALLARRLLEAQPPVDIRLRGVAVINPSLDNEAQRGFDGCGLIFRTQ
jgi:carboxypeptidase C (cathepsin A)